MRALLLFEGGQKRRERRERREEGRGRSTDRPGKGRECEGRGERRERGFYYVLTTVMLPGEERGKIETNGHQKEGE